MRSFLHLFDVGYIVVFYLATVLCSMTELLGGDAPTLVSDCSEPVEHR